MKYADDVGIAGDAVSTLSGALPERKDKVSMN